jgi:hypothetical protein
MPKFKDLSGQRFVKLLVLHRVENNRKGNAMFLCQCDCGNTKDCTGISLTSGDIKSCGCLPRSHPIHGRCKTTEYKSWGTMMQRCYNPKHRAYPWYGGRGIVVVERWHTAANFLNDMGPKPTPKHTVDRRDNDGPYSPENCSWETRKHQMRNRRNNRLLTYNGVTKCLADWADDYKISASAVIRRLKRHWNIHDALTAPSDRKIQRRYHHASSVCGS